MGCYSFHGRVRACLVLPTFFVDAFPFRHLEPVLQSFHTTSASHLFSKVFSEASMWFGFTSVMLISIILVLAQAEYHCIIFECDSQHSYLQSQRVIGGEDTGASSLEAIKRVLQITEL